MTSNKSPRTFELQDTSSLSNAAKSWSFRGLGNLLTWQKLSCGGGKKVGWEEQNGFLSKEALQLRYLTSVWSSEHLQRVFIFSATLFEKGGGSDGNLTVITETLLHKFTETRDSA